MRDLGPDLRGQVLIERAAERDIDQLDAAADAEHGLAGFDEFAEQLHLVVVAHQVTGNVVGWDTPISTKLPWFALADPYVTTHVTIADLFAHRSGLPDHAGDRLEDIGYDRRKVLDRLRLLPLDPFRISYAYTNFGLTTAAEAVAAASGKPWDVLSDEVLYRPLGMHSTSSRFDDFVARPNHAVGHVKTPDGYQPLPQWLGQTRAPAPAKTESFAVETFAEGLNGAAFQFLPDGRILLGERNGRIRIIGKDGRASQPLAGMPSDMYTMGQSLFSVQPDKDFATNRTIYFTYAVLPAGADPAKERSPAHAHVASARISSGNTSLTVR